jgi:hypothetical protein
MIAEATGVDKRTSPASALRYGVTAASQPS